jgi:cysteinyl-tRNA synthetase
MLGRLYDAREVAEKMRGDEDPDAVAAALGPDALEVLRLSRAFPAAFHAFLDEDFNTAGALGLAFELARAVNRFSNHKKALARGAPVVAAALAGFALVGSAIGLLAMTTASFGDELKAKVLPTLGLTRDEVDAKVAARWAARAARDWATADRLRDELEGNRIALMDRADGTDWKIRL